MMRATAYVVYIISFFIVLYWIVLKRRAHPRSAMASSGIEDQKALDAAEQAVKSIDLREEFSKQYDFLDSFSTMQGYSEDYMLQIILQLEKNNIAADFVFVESGPPGMAGLTQRQGLFELHVQKDCADAAAEIIRIFRASHN